MGVAHVLHALAPSVEVTALAYAPDGRHLAVGGASGRPVVVDASSGRPAVELPARRFGGTTAVAYGRGGRLIAAGSGDGLLQLVDAGSGRLVRRLVVASSTPAATHAVDDVDFSPDGSRVLVSAGDGFASVFDVRSGTRLWRRRADAWFATGARFSRDGRLAAVGGGQKGAVVFLDAATGRRVGPTIRAVAGFVTSLDFDPSGRTLATSGTDGSVRLWDVATREQLGADLRGASAATFFPDGRRLLASQSDGSGFVWTVDGAALAQRACRIAGRSLTEAEWRTFLPHRRYARTC
jgi:WD40 repeat protein